MGGCGVRASRRVIPFLTVLGLHHRIWRIHRSARILGIVTWPDSTHAYSCHLGTLSVTDVPVASPERRSTLTVGVVVGRRRSIALLFLVVADKNDLQDGGDEKEEQVDDGDGEDGRLELAGKAKAGP